MLLEGTIKKNELGRWEFSGYELTSGSKVEIMILDSWVWGRIEYAHDIKDYVFLAGPKEKVFRLTTGMRAQIFL